MGDGREIHTSLVVPIFNGVRYLPSFWASVLPEIDKSTEVIVVDDGSSEDVWATVPNIENAARVVHLKNEKNRGYSPTVNRAMEQASGRYFIHLNTDLILTPGILSRLRHTLEHRSDIGCLGAKLIYPQTGKIQHIGMSFTKGNKYHFFQYMDASHPLADISRDVQSTTGAILAFPRALYEKIGPWDEQFFNCNEDVDYCFRAKQIGLKSHVDAGACAYHWESQSGYSRFVRFTENEAKFWAKWGNSISSDAAKYIEESLRYTLSLWPQFGEMRPRIVNLSKGSTETAVVDVLNAVLPLTAAEPPLDFAQRNNPSDKLPLPMILPHSLMFMPTPIIYVVDCFEQLANNQYWFMRRQQISGGDMVIDHLGNCMTTNELSAVC